MTLVFVPKETAPGETRVAVTPETVEKMAKRGLEIRIEAGAGAASGIMDAQYQEAGAEVTADGRGALGKAPVVLKVAPLSGEEIQALAEGALVVSFLFPARNLDGVAALAARKVTAFAMELVPRITKAQKMDALSSQANIAGYKAVIRAADTLGRYFPLLMTAAGTVKPARVFIFGAGVAGLQAIATARRLGAVVEATDIRPVVKEQVESLGARFVMVEPEGDAQDEGGYAKEASEEYRKKQAALVGKHVALADVVITTAQVPGRKAPVLMPAEMVATMKPGSVIVDLAADQGGNCALTQAGKAVVEHGVTILGPVNLPATVPFHASELYARNVLHVVEHLIPEKDVQLDFEDPITAGSIAVHAGEIRHAPTAEALKSTASR